MFSSDYSVSFKWNSRVGGKRCPVGFPTEVAVTKPNLANGSNNLELEAATEAIAPDWSFDHVRDLLRYLSGNDGRPTLCVSLSKRVANVTQRSVLALSASMALPLLLAAYAGHLSGV